MALLLRISANQDRNFMLCGGHNFRFNTYQVRTYLIFRHCRMTVTENC